MRKYEAVISILYEVETEQEAKDLFINDVANGNFRVNVYGGEEEFVEMNEVTCGNCGKIMSHEVGHEGDLTCKSCGYTSEQCDFPDFDKEDYLHGQVNEWIIKNDLPMISLDEIPLHLFNEQQLKERNDLLTMFFNL